MYKLVFLFLLSNIIAATTNAQRSATIESIHFHLYTDSLKKGQHNYINIDGKLSNGRWKPLTEKELVFTVSNGKMEGNELIIPDNFSSPSITINVSLKGNAAMNIEKTVWIKILPDPELLPKPRS